MPCASIKKFSYDPCLSNLGGVKEIYLANYVANAAQVVTETGATEGTITGFTTGVTWEKYQFRKNTCSMTSTLNVNDGGSNYWSTELSMVFGRMDANKRLAIQALVLGEAMAIVVDANGESWFLGQDEPLSATSGTGQTGTAKSDSNNYTIVLTDESMEAPRRVADTVVEGIRTAGDEGE